MCNTLDTHAPCSQVYMQSHIYTQSTYIQLTQRLHTWHTWHTHTQHTHAYTTYIYRTHTTQTQNIIIQIQHIQCTLAHTHTHTQHIYTHNTHNTLACTHKQAHTHTNACNRYIYTTLGTEIRTHTRTHTHTLVLVLPLPELTTWPPSRGWASRRQQDWWPRWQWGNQPHLPSCMALSVH